MIYCIIIMKYKTVKTNSIKLDNEQKNLIKDELLKLSNSCELSCATAFKIAGKLKIPVINVGKTADSMNYKFINCQLGLFGRGKKGKNRPEKPKFKTLPNKSALQNAICKSLVKKRLPCKKAFQIASDLNINKLQVVDECKYKISDCQLGAF